MEVAIRMVAYVHVHDLQKAGFLSLSNREGKDRVAVWSLEGLSLAT
jgi:hypothetical protein